MDSVWTWGMLAAACPIVAFILFRVLEGLGFTPWERLRTPLWWGAWITVLAPLLPAAIMMWKISLLITGCGILLTFIMLIVIVFIDESQLTLIWPVIQPAWRGIKQILRALRGAPTPVVRRFSAPAGPTATPAPAAAPQKPAAPAPAPETAPLPCRAIKKLDLPTRQIQASDLSSLTELGSGGEAVVYQVDGTTAWKVFRLPDDPFYSGHEPEQKREQTRAAERLAAYPAKLPDFPAWLGSRVVRPREILKRDSRHPVGGYAMSLVEGGVPLRKYSQQRWKTKHRVGIRDIGRIFLDLYDTLCEVHGCGLMIGDFKPDNVLVTEHAKAFIVDAESMAYGDYQCRTFSEGYVDPQLCDPKADCELLSMPYRRISDWYSFTVMLFQALTNIHPYEGVYHPPKGKHPVVPARRALLGISVFNKHVVVPNFTQSIKELPEALQQFFFNTFEAGLREKPSRELIEALLPPTARKGFYPVSDTCWEKFTLPAAPAAAEEEIFLPALYDGPGQVLAVRILSGKAAFLIKEGSQISRENGTLVIEEDDGEFNHWQVAKNAFVFGLDGNQPPFDGPFYLVPTNDQGQTLKIPRVDPAENGTPNIALMGKRLFWIEEGRLRRSDRKHSLARLRGCANLLAGPKFSLIVLTDQGELSGLVMVTPTATWQLSALPPILGRVIECDCSFSTGAAWLFLTVEWGSSHTRYVLVVDSSGDLVAMGAAPEKSGEWYAKGVLRAAIDPSTLGATHPELAALTPAGLVRVACKDLTIVPKSSQKWTAAGKPRALLADKSNLLVLLEEAQQHTAEALPPEAAAQESEGDVICVSNQAVPEERTLA